MALEIGRYDADRLGDEMSSPQLAGWEAYFTALHELGDEAIAAMTGAPVEPMPPRTPEEEEHELRALFRLHNERIAETTDG